jgi:hypothetical protein
VQPKLAARVRLLNTGQVNKNDPNDARSVAVTALRGRGLREISAEDDTAILRVWARRYRDLGSLRTQVVCRLRAALCELAPAYYHRKLDQGMGRKAALRALKRAISNTTYVHMINDIRRAETVTQHEDPGGQTGNDSVSSAAGSHLNTSSSDKPIPGRHPL